MPKILVVNNYSLDFDIEEIQRLKKPEQTVWGINYLQEWGYDVILIPQTKSRKLRKLNQFINKFLPMEIGD